MKQNKFLAFIVICLFLSFFYGCAYETNNTTDIPVNSETPQQETLSHTEEQVNIDYVAEDVEDVVSEKIEVKSEDSNIEETIESNPQVIRGSENPELSSGLEVHYIDVGQGDCSLVVCDGEAMLIDAGGNDKGTAIQYYLKKQNISTLKYVVASHPDADHIGGLDVIIYKFNCQNILMPNTSNDTKTYEEVLSAIESKGYKVTVVDEGESYELGSAEIEILSPPKAHPYADTNNDSIILRVIYGNTRFLFTGDTLVQPQQVIVYDDELDASADVVKVPHHGADSAYMKGFYDEINPKYAVISVGADNKYGHPHQNILDDLHQRGVSLFRTDEQGTIIAKSDGINIVFNCQPSETWQSGQGHENNITNDYEASVSENVGIVDGNDINVDNAISTNITYVYNKNSGKFHLPTCASVDDMKQKNRVDLTCSREELLQKYPDASPCKRCNP